MTGRVVAVAVTAAVIAAVAAALILVGSPRTARLERLDERRIADIDALADRVLRYRNDEGHLPETLDALEPMLPDRLGTRDPATGAPYAYERTGEDFRLCATLAAPDGQAVDRRARPARPGDDREVVPDVDATGRTYCLKTVEREPG